MNKADIKEQVLERLQNMDERQRYMIFGGVLLFIFLLDYFLLMKPQLDTLYKVTSDIKVLTTQFKEGKENITKKGFYVEEVEKLTKEVAKSNQKVRSKDELPSILEQISLLADQSNVKIDQVMPKADSQELLLENNDKRYFALPIFIQASSGYHNFGRFINSLENSNIFFNVKSFTISSSDDLKQHKIILTLNAIIFEKNTGQQTPPLTP